MITIRQCSRNKKAARHAYGKLIATVNCIRKPLTTNKVKKHTHHRHTYIEYHQIFTIVLYAKHRHTHPNISHNCVIP